MSPLTELKLVISIGDCGLAKILCQRKYQQNDALVR